MQPGGQHRIAGKFLPPLFVAGVPGLPGYCDGTCSPNRANERDRREGRKWTCVSTSAAPLTNLGNRIYLWLPTFLRDPRPDENGAMWVGCEHGTGDDPRDARLMPHQRVRCPLMMSEARLRAIHVQLNWKVMQTN